MPTVSDNLYVIPAQHTGRLRAILAGKEPSPVPKECLVQQVLSADSKYIFDVPIQRIAHLCASGRASRLVLCSKYDPTNPSVSCRDPKCAYVHADLQGLSFHAVHINYAWPSVDDVFYARFDAGRRLEVAAPNSKNVVDVFDSSMALKTKALSVGAWRRPLSHCAHYYFNRTCNVGPDCQFIHAVFIDPNAKPHQRAPAPKTLGRVGTIPDHRIAALRYQPRPRGPSLEAPPSPAATRTRVAEQWAPSTPVPLPPASVLLGQAPYYTPPTRGSAHPRWSLSVNDAVQDDASFRLCNEAPRGPVTRLLDLVCESPYDETEPTPTVVKPPVSPTNRMSMSLQSLPAARASCRDNMELLPANTTSSTGTPRLSGMHSAERSTVTPTLLPVAFLHHHHPHGAGESIGTPSVYRHDPYRWSTSTDQW